MPPKGSRKESVRAASSARKGARTDESPSTTQSPSDGLADTVASKTDALSRPKRLRPDATRKRVMSHVSDSDSQESRGRDTSDDDYSSGSSEENPQSHEAQTTEAFARSATVAQMPASDAEASGRDELPVSNGASSGAARQARFLASSLQCMVQNVEGLGNEIESLTADNDELRKDISSLRRVSQDVSDQDLCRRMRALASSIQTWAAQNLREADFASATKEAVDRDSPEVQKVGPVDPQMFQGMKVPVGQAILGVEITRILQAETLLPSKIAREGAALVSYAEANHDESEPQRAELLRVMINKLLYNVSEEDFVAQTKNGRKYRKASTVKTLETQFGTPVSKVGHKALNSIMSDAFKLTSIIRLQAAEYEVKLPEAGTALRTMWMNDRYGSYFEEAESGEIWLSLFPALVKLSDARMIKLPEPCIVSRARVVIA